MSVFSKAFILSDVFASGEYYNIYSKIKYIALESEIKKCTKDAHISLNFSEVPFKSTSEKENFTGNYLKSERVSVSLIGSDSK